MQETRHLLVAPDKFRGTATASEAAAAMARGARAVGWTVDSAPLADGGEGIVDVLGGPNQWTEVTGPLGESVRAPWRFHEGTAVVETAAASGILLVGGPSGNDPVAATTRGTGELVVAALETGAERVIVGVGGSASTDGGVGALAVLADHPRVRDVELVVACDVRTTFLDAAPRFGPQKGASPEQVAYLQDRLAGIADDLARRFGIDVRSLPGSGAAGGLAGGLAAVGGVLVDGFELVAAEVSLDGRMKAADLVVTGEGCLDQASFEGKVVGGVYRRAQGIAVDVVAVVGDIADGTESEIAVCSLVADFGRRRALAATATCLELATARLCRSRP